MLVVILGARGCCKSRHDNLTQNLAGQSYSWQRLLHTRIDCTWSTYPQVGCYAVFFAAKWR
jgi:hypothetical protein